MFSPIPIASVATRNSTSPGLEEIHLRVAGARTERAHDDRRPAALTADELGDGVDRVGGEGDDGAAARQARQLLGTGVGQLAEKRSRNWMSASGQSRRINERDGRRAHQHGLRGPARMQQPMGKDVAAFGVGAELDFIDGEKLDLAVERHRLDSADKIARPSRDDLFFAGDQRDLSQAAGLDHAIVDLAREQPQGQPDHARGVS